jgi:hypothetical protein
MLRSPLLNAMQLDERRAAHGVHEHERVIAALERQVFEDRCEERVARRSASVDPTRAESVPRQCVTTWASAHDPARRGPGVTCGHGARVQP